jgi:cation transport ATPase
MTPDMWKETQKTKTPNQEYTDYFANKHHPVFLAAFFLFILRIKTQKTSAIRYKKDTA